MASVNGSPHWGPIPESFQSNPTGGAPQAQRLLGKCPLDSREVFFEHPQLKLPSDLTSRLSVPPNVIVLGLDSWEHVKKFEKVA